MNKITSIAMAFLLPCSAVNADGANTVVELFTSQGCSSCPPAEELISQISQIDNVIALSLHVDYWDYIGWTDLFANAKYSERQKRYATRAGRRMVYTPQIIIQGETEVSARQPLDVLSSISDESTSPRPVLIDVERSDNGFELNLKRFGSAEAGPFEVQLVKVFPEKVVNVRAGENAGKTLIHTNVVYDWELIGLWDGVHSQQVFLEVGDENRSVVLVQQAGQGRIVAAEWLD
ncbi:DUF1223 domain-containing protein [Pelagovum sp. HNIBRBA483]|uniref:DUF1223 domain-containing protein n=1 Tax=Pelagovum sp. HNIBRBA483 TaxID=3233341 RepID=UPI0034A0EB14